MKTTKHFNSGITLEDIEENSPLENVQKIKEFMRHKYERPECYGAIFTNDIKNLIEEAANAGKLDEMLNIEFLSSICDSDIYNSLKNPNHYNGYNAYSLNFIPTLLAQLDSVEAIHKFAMIEDSTLVVRPFFGEFYNFREIFSKLDSLIPEKDKTFLKILASYHSDYEEIQQQFDFEKIELEAQQLEEQQLKERKLYEVICEKISKNFIRIQSDSDVHEIAKILKNSSEALAVFESFIDLGKFVTCALDFDDLKNALLKAQRMKNLSCK